MVAKKKRAAMVFIPSLLFILVMIVSDGSKPFSPMPASNVQIVNVAKVIDGDTFDLNDGRRVRLWGIDAPEKRQSCFSQIGAWPCGISSTEWLEESILGETLNCQEISVDRQNRIVAKCYLNGSDIAEEMVRAGWARDWQKYSGGAYASSEQSALENRIGVYRD